MGTTGTMMGVGRYLRDVKPDVTLISMQPDSPFNGLEGLKHLETAIVPPIYDASVADRNVECRTEDAGGNVHTALRIAREAPRGSVVVTILCDGADRYLSEKFWEDEPEPSPQI
jgi:cysteine synthase B